MRTLSAALLGFSAAATALVVSSNVEGGHAQQSSAQRSRELLVDAAGLAFDNLDAFCAFHCSSTHLGGRPECDPDVCGHGRELRWTAASSTEEDKSITAIDFITCQGVDQSGASVAFQVDPTAVGANVLRGFPEAFFAAFDAMITSANATYDACQLQLLQQELLPTLNESDSESSKTEDMQKLPMLIKLRTDTADMRSCVEQVQTLGVSAQDDTDHSITPFLSRQDQSAASATILLMHLNSSTSLAVNALECVESVLELPAILKLMPFARSIYQLTRVLNSSTNEMPALEIQLVRGSDQSSVLAILESQLQALRGVTNVFELPDEAAHRPRSLFTKAVADISTWSDAVALALNQSNVEWVDVRTTTSPFALRAQDSVAVPEKSDSPSSFHRRLDDYVDSLVGVDEARNNGIRGTDIIVGVTDSGLYLDHDQFDQESRSIYTSADQTARKVVYYNGWANKVDESETVTCGHGTHVSGILAGSSYSGEDKDLGLADKAKIAFMDIGMQASNCAGESGCAVVLSTPADASDLLLSQINVGAKIFSFSWGTTGSDYSSQARDLDAYIYKHPEILVVVAAGNNGETTTDGQGTISSPSGAKNVISVGASLNYASTFSAYSCSSIYNENSVASFSSAGPTTDGRLKPDVVAPGMSVVSSQSNKPGSTAKTSATCSLQGTSQATPVVTGLAVLLYEWLRDGWWKNGSKNPDYAMTTIPAALLKALIIHSGQSLSKRMAASSSTLNTCSKVYNAAWGLSFPDYYQGYGKPNMSNLADFDLNTNSKPSLYFLPNSTNGSEPSVGHGKNVSILFTVPRGVDLRATLVWTDPAGSVRATTQLQHDLDLTVRLYNGSTTFCPLTADNSTNRDEKNNVEMVQVSYDELLAAVTNESSSLLGSNGEIVVEAVIYGRSVLQANTQTFAFVASSSVIGTASSSSNTTDLTSGGSNLWSPWMIGGCVTGAVLLLLIIALSVRYSVRRRAARGAITSVAILQGYRSHSTPGAAALNTQRCPYCAFRTLDPVVLVNHVEHLHNGGGTGSVSSAALLSVAPVETCPFCAFTTPDAVILVNHVQFVHRT